MVGRPTTRTRTRTHERAGKVELSDGEGGKTGCYVPGDLFPLAIYIGPHGVACGFRRLQCAHKTALTPACSLRCWREKGLVVASAGSSRVQLRDARGSR